MFSLGSGERSQGCPRPAGMACFTDTFAQVDKGLSVLTAPLARLIFSLAPRWGLCWLESLRVPYPCELFPCGSGVCYLALVMRLLERVFCRTLFQLQHSRRHLRLSGVGRHREREHLLGPGLIRR